MSFTGRIVKGRLLSSQLRVIMSDNALKKKSPRLAIVLRLKIAFYDRNIAFPVKDWNRLADCMIFSKVI